MQYEQITKIAKDWGVVVFGLLSMWFIVQQLQVAVNELKTTTSSLTSIVGELKYNTGIRLENHEARINNLEYKIK
jgi:hypothetical protein